MLILRNIIIILLLLTLTAISVVGIMVEAPAVMGYTPDRVNALGRSVLTVMRPGNLLFFSRIVVLAGSLLVPFLTIVYARKRMKIEVETSGGRVVIMDAAIKKHIRNALTRIGSVKVKKIELREKRHRINTDIYADVRGSDNLPILEQKIIERTRVALAEDLGIKNLGDVHVFIRNFELSGKPVKSYEEEKPEPPVVTPSTDTPIKQPALAAAGAVLATSADNNKDVPGSPEPIADAPVSSLESESKSVADETKLGDVIAPAMEQTDSTATTESPIKLTFPADEAAGVVEDANLKIDTDLDIPSSPLSSAAEAETASDDLDKKEDKPL